MDDFDIALRALITVFSLVMFALAFMAYRRVASRRLLLAVGVFGLFLVKGMILTFTVIYKEYNPLVTEVWFHSMFDAAILAALFFGLLRAPPRPPATAKGHGGGQ